MDNYLLDNLDEQAALSGYDQFRYSDDQNLFSNTLDLCRESTLNDPLAYYPPVQHPDQNLLTQNLMHGSPTQTCLNTTSFSNLDDPSTGYFVNPESLFVNNLNRVENVQTESDLEFDNLDLKSLKKSFYTEEDETFLNDYLENFESDLRPETANNYVAGEACQPELSAGFEANSNDKPETKSSLDDFVRRELVGVTENFELNYELDAFELPPELNGPINRMECPPMNSIDAGSASKSKPRNQAKQRKLIRCDLCLYTSFDKHKIKRHYLTHSKVKPFNCGECGSSFTQSGTLKTHITKAHQADRTVQFDPNINTDCLRGPTFCEQQTNEQFGSMNQVRTSVVPNEMLVEDTLSYQINSQLTTRMSNMMNEQSNCQMNLGGGHPTGYSMVSPVANPIADNSFQFSSNFNNADNSHQMTGHMNSTYQFNQMNQSGSTNFQIYQYYPNYQTRSSNLNALYPVNYQTSQMASQMTSPTINNQTVGQFGRPETQEKDHRPMISEECSKIFDFMY